MEDTAATRQATKARIGPWYVLQARNPAAPGMKFSTLLALVGKGQVTPRSIVRGPTSHQLWRFAAHVRGLSREFGICYSCGESVEKVAAICPHCDRTQEPPADPDALLEPRGNASAMLGGVTGNSHGAATRRAAPITAPAQSAPSQSGSAPSAPSQPAPTAPASPTREYEIPRHPPAYVSPQPPRGEHSERLRAFNQEIAASRSPAALVRRDARVSGIDLASAFRADPDEVDRSGGGFRRIVSVLFLLALVGGGVYFYMNPEARKKAGAWLQDRLQQAQSKSTANNPDLPAWDNRPPAPSARQNAGTVATNSSQRKFSEQSFVIPQLPAPSTQPGATRQPEVQKRSETPAKTQPKIEKSEPPKYDDAPPAVMGDDAAIQRSRALWTRAIDAEAKNDFAEAVRCYEQIKLLPRVAHQPALDIRLNNAKQNLAR
ncbi:hypothetical protein BH09PLA1_BH09PLA1_24080 [soil metagenome]